MTYWIFWGIDALIAAIAVFFFVIGLMDGSVSSFNMGLWTFILAGLAAMLWGAHAFRRARKELLAKILLGVLAVPGVLAGLFLLTVLILNPRWN